MCTSKITARKFVKLLSERYFYAIVLFVLFLISGYSAFSVKEFLNLVFPFFQVNTNFTVCFLLFYLFIPFLNKLIHALNEKEHRVLILLSVFIYVVLPSFAKASVSFNYIVWFNVLYIIASFLRLYPKSIFDKTGFWGRATIISIILSWSSIVTLAWIGKKIGRSDIAYFFVSDSNKILAVMVALCAFLFFKNLNIKQNKIINSVAASTFGVLLIHANSDTMRHWLWKDTLENVEYYNSPSIVIHSVCSVILVYVVCTAIDQLRIRFIERPLIKKCSFSADLKF